MIRNKWKIDRSYKDTCIDLLTENLSALRAKADITQEEIADIVGTSRQTYYSIETRQRTMSWTRIFRYYYSSIRTILLVACCVI